MLKDFDIVGSYDNQRSTTINAERSVNLFEYIDPSAKRPKVLIPTSGIVDTNLPFTATVNGSRASFVFKDVIYQVFGSRVYSISGITGALQVDFLGTLTTSTGYVGIDANTYQVIFVDGQFGYIWDTVALTFTQITDTSFPLQPIDVCYLDGFFVVANGNTNNFYLSEFNQGLAWGGGASATTITADSAPGNNWLVLPSTVNYETGVDFQIASTGTIPAPLVADTDYYAIRVDATHIRVASSLANAQAGIAIVLSTNGAPTITITGNSQLQVGSITTHPGNIVACRTLHRRLFLFSTNYTEVWENAGIGTNLPFRRNNNALMEVGTPALGSIVVGFDKMFFLSQDRGGLSSVMEVIGTEAIPASNKALDFQLAQYAATNTAGVSWVSDARGIIIKENGLIFYRLNFTLANHTFVLGVSMSAPGQPRWHEEEVLNGDRHLAQTQAYLGGVNYYGAYNSATLYYADTTISTNDGEAIRRMRISRNFAPEGYVRTRIDRFQLDLLQGVPDTESVEEIDLLTESSLTILTESGEDIILDQDNGSNFSQPVVFLSVSKDGGQSYGYEISGLMGKVGERTYRTVWRKLGVIPRGQGTVVRIQFFNNVPFIVLGAAWSFEIMPE